MKKLSLALLLCSSLVGVEAGNAAAEITGAEPAEGTHLLPAKQDHVNLYVEVVGSREYVPIKQTPSLEQKNGFVLGKGDSYQDLLNKIKLVYDNFDPSVDFIYLDAQTPVTVATFDKVFSNVKDGDALYILAAPANPAVPK